MLNATEPNRVLAYFLQKLRSFKHLASLRQHIIHTSILLLAQMIEITAFLGKLLIIDISTFFWTAGLGRC